MQDKIQALQSQVTDYTLLYIEDNPGLRKNIEKLLGKFFRRILIAQDGLEGFELYKEQMPQIVITDINMPRMDGFTLAEKIRNVNPRSKVIILSAYDDKEHLYQAIQIGAFRYLRKPVKVANLIDILSETADAISEEENYLLFQNQLQEVFDYQNHLVMMMKEDEPVLVNQRFLEFFGVEDLKMFMDENKSLDPLLLEHTDFLYSTPEESWYDHAKLHPGKLFHTKIANHEGESRHLILKLQPIPKKENYSVISLDDITELNLLGLYDSDAASKDQLKQAKDAVLKMMKVVKDNASKVKIHNFYKGLTITNPAVIVECDGKVVLKTTFTQLKAVHLVKNMTISSEIFPNDVLCKTVEKVDFDAQTITLSDMQFTQRSATERESIRLEPEHEHKVSLFYNSIKISSDTRIIDLSDKAAKVEINALPAGMKVDDTVRVSMVLPSGQVPLTINTEGTLYRIDEYKRHYHIVLLYELPESDLAKLKRYLADRQMTLIREFKALEIHS